MQIFSLRLKYTERPGDNHNQLTKNGYSFTISVVIL